MSGVPGHYKVTATIAGHQAHAKITVEGIERLTSVSSVPGLPISSRDKPKKTSSLTPNDKRAVQVATAPTAASAKRTLTPRKPLRAAATSLASQPMFQGTGE